MHKLQAICGYYLTGMIGEDRYMTYGLGWASSFHSIEGILGLFLSFTLCLKTGTSPCEPVGQPDQRIKPSQRNDLLDILASGTNKLSEREGAIPYKLCSEREVGK